MPSTFLTARWSHLVMANYIVEPAVLDPYLPKGTELDLWEGNAFASLVGFLFLDTKVLGVGWPWHRNFEEVNLRFYVRRKVEGQWHRGVVFVSEIVPKMAIPLIANTLFGEHYEAMPMAHILERHPDGKLRVRYQWEKQSWHHIEVEARQESQPIAGGSTEEFIFEHYWGYGTNRQGETLEYQVEHPRWEVFPVSSYDINCDVELLYGKAFVPALTAEPHSVFLAEGSDVQVRWGKKL